MAEGDTLDSIFSRSKAITENNDLIHAIKFYSSEIMESFKAAKEYPKDILNCTIQPKIIISQSSFFNFHSKRSALIESPSSYCQTYLQHNLSNTFLNCQQLSLTFFFSFHLLPKVLVKTPLITYSTVIHVISPTCIH